MKNNCVNKYSQFSWQICHSLPSEPACKKRKQVIKETVFKIPGLTDSICYEKKYQKLRKFFGGHLSRASVEHYILMYVSLIDK